MKASRTTAQRVSGARACQAGGTAEAKARRQPLLEGSVHQRREGGGAGSGHSKALEAPRQSLDFGLCGHKRPLKGAKQRHTVM